MSDKRFNMEEFNRICTDCGLIHMEDLPTNSIFGIKHPLSELPIIIAVYVKAKDSTEDCPYEFIAVEINERKYAMVLPFMGNYIRTYRPWELDAAQLREAINNIKSYLDAEYESRKGNNISLERLFHFVTASADRLYNTSVELSCSVQEFLNNMYGVTATFKKDNS